PRISFELPFVRVRSSVVDKPGDKVRVIEGEVTLREAAEVAETGNAVNVGFVALPLALVIVTTDADKGLTVRDTLDDEGIVPYTDVVRRCRTLPVPPGPPSAGLGDGNPVEFRYLGFEPVPLPDRMSTEVDVTKMLAECTLLASDPDAVQELISDERFDEDTVSAINELFKADSA
ncbi:hypothetical protein LTR81_028049, partial [Elasticomyces elasticus]